MHTVSLLFPRHSLLNTHAYCFTPLSTLLSFLPLLPPSSLSVLLLFFLLFFLPSPSQPLSLLFPSLFFPPPLPNSLSSFSPPLPPPLSSKYSCILFPSSFHATLFSILLHT